MLYSNRCSINILKINFPFKIISFFLLFIIRALLMPSISLVDNVLNISTEQQEKGWIYSFADLAS